MNQRLLTWEKNNHELAAEMRQGLPFLEKHECWKNSVMTLACLPDATDVYYIEGWLVQDDFAFEHGWLEIDGEIVDVSLDNEDAKDYFGVYRYSYDQCLKATKGRTKLPYYVNHKKRRKEMIDSFLLLPINHLSCYMTAQLGAAVTGIDQIYITPEANPIWQSRLAQLWPDLAATRSI